MVKERTEITSPSQAGTFVDKIIKEEAKMEEEIEQRSKGLNVEEYIESKLSSIDMDHKEDVIEIRQITLRMAKMWDTKGHIYEAIDLYKKLIKNHNGSTEAKEAKTILTNFAKRFEQEGRYHLAQSLYDELFL